MSDASKALLEIGALLFLVSSLVVFLTLILVSQSRQRMEAKKVKAELSYAREYIDHRLDEINQAYAENYNLWAEANRLPVEAQLSEQNQENTEQDFLSRIGIDFGKIEVKKNQALILMPIDKKYASVLRALQKACSTNLYSAKRSDQDFVQVNLLGRIVQLILESELIICDISTRNPNVMYELGIAHALNKNTIIISEQKELDQSPFDVQSNRILLYRDHYDLEMKLTRALHEFKFKTISRLGLDTHS